MADDVAYNAVKEILSLGTTLVFHNAKFDLQKLIRANLLSRDSLPQFHDTECLSHLIDEHQKKDLKTLAVEILGIKNTIRVPIKSGPNAGEYREVERESHRLKQIRTKLKLKKSDGYHRLPREAIVPYALADAAHTLGVFEKLWPQLEEHDLYYKEMELVLVTMDMEGHALGVDVPYTTKAAKETNTEILRAEKTISELTGLSVWHPEKSGQKTPEGCINPASVQQLIAAFEGRGIKIPNTRNETLKPLDDELAVAILKLRKEKKLLDYLLAILKEQVEGVIHPNFRIFKPVTGRFASGKVEE